MFKEDYKNDNLLINPDPKAVSELLEKMRAVNMKPRRNFKKTAYSLGTIAACAAIVICCVMFLPLFNKSSGIVGNQIINAESTVAGFISQVTSEDDLFTEEIDDAADERIDKTLDAEVFEVADENESSDLFQEDYDIALDSSLVETESPVSDDNSFKIAGILSNADEIAPETNDVEDEMVEEDMLSQSISKDDNDDESENIDNENADEQCIVIPPKTIDEQSEDSDEDIKDDEDEFFSEEANELESFVPDKNFPDNNKDEEYVNRIVNSDFEVFLNGKYYKSYYYSNLYELKTSGGILFKQKFTDTIYMDNVTFVFYKAYGISTDFMIVGINFETGIKKLFINSYTDYSSLNAKDALKLISFDKLAISYVCGRREERPITDEITKAIQSIENSNTVSKPVGINYTKFVVNFAYIPSVSFSVYRNGVIYCPLNSQYYKLSDENYAIILSIMDS